MALPSLPPRGYFIPTHMIFKSQLPPAVFLTWLQLRSLTWRGNELPSLPVHTWVDLTGTSRTTFFRHLNLLQVKHALRWHSPAPGVVSVSFLRLPKPPHPHHAPVLTVPRSTGLASAKEFDVSKMDCPKMDSSKLDDPNLDSSPSLNPPPSSPYIPVLEPGILKSVQDIKELEAGEEEGFLDSRNPESQIPDSKNPESQIPSPLPSHDPDSQGLSSPVPSELAQSSPFPPDSHPETPPPNFPISDPTGLTMSDSDPVSIYHSLTHLTPNEVQVKLIRSKVTNRYLWKITLEHWLWHNWNLRNIPGLLDLYSRNGDLGCRSCHKPPPSTRNVRV